MRRNSPTLAPSSPPRRSGHLAGSVAGVLLAALLLVPSGATAAPLMPEFPHAAPELWINGPPVQAAELRGRVVLLDLFTEG